MQIPSSSTLLLAVASIAVISGRFLHLHVRPVWGLSFFLVSLFAVAVMSTVAVAPVNSTVTLIDRPPFVDDALARSEHWLVLAFSVVAGIAFVDAHRNEHAALIQYGFLMFGAAALLLVSHSNDFLALGLSLEIVNLVLVALRESSRQHRFEETKKTTDHRSAWISSGWMWVGIAILANATNTTNFDELRLILTNAYEPGHEQVAIGSPSKLVLLGAGLITLSLFARMGLVPFHLGLISPREDGSPVVETFERLLNQVAGYITLTRLYGVTFVGLSHSLATLLMAVCLASFVVSSVMVARGESPGVKSIPYWVSSLILFQGAWYVVGLMIASLELGIPSYRWGSFAAQNETLAVCVYAQLVSVLTCGGVYWSLAHLDRDDREPAYLEDVKGLIQFAPVAAMSLTIALIGGIGLPLTAGFWSRWLILLAGHSVHLKVSTAFAPHPGLRVVMLASTVATMVTATFVVRIIREMWLEAPLARPVAIGGRGPLISGTIAATCVLLLGIVPQVVLIPLQSIRPSRLSTPEANQKGSGEVPMGERKPNGNPFGEIPLTQNR